MNDLTVRKVRLKINKILPQTNNTCRCFSTFERQQFPYFQFCRNHKTQINTQKPFRTTLMHQQSPRAGGGGKPAVHFFCSFKEGAATLWARACRLLKILSPPKADANLSIFQSFNYQRTKKCTRICSRRPSWYWFRAKKRKLWTMWSFRPTQTTRQWSHHPPNWG